MLPESSALMGPAISWRYLSQTIYVYNEYKTKNPHASRSRQAVNSLLSSFNRFPPKCPNCSQWTACTGSSSRSTRSSPATVIRIITVRRSLVSRERETNPRFCSRSSSRVISGSRVISWLRISPHESPAGASRKIRSVLYCVGDKSSFFRIWHTLCDRMSAVRTSSRKADSSRLPLFGVLGSCRHTPIIYRFTNTVPNKYFPRSLLGYVGNRASHKTRSKGFESRLKECKKKRSDLCPRPCVPRTIRAVARISYQKGIDRWHKHSI